MSQFDKPFSDFTLNKLGGKKNLQNRLQELDQFKMGPNGNHQLLNLNKKRKIGSPSRKL